MRIDQYIGEVSGKLDLLLKSHGSLEDKVDKLNVYAHETKHELKNDIAAVDGRVQLNRHLVDEQDNQLERLISDVKDLKKGQQKQLGFVAGVSATISFVVAAIGAWFKFGGQT